MALPTGAFGIIGSSVVATIDTVALLSSDLTSVPAKAVEGISTSVSTVASLVFNSLEFKTDVLSLYYDNYINDK